MKLKQFGYILDTDTGLTTVDPDIFSWAQDALDIVNDIQEPSWGDWGSVALQTVQLAGVPPEDAPPL